jgi:hypothetical protein
MNPYYICSRNQSEIILFLMGLKRKYMKGPRQLKSFKDISWWKKYISQKISCRTLKLKERIAWVFLETKTEVEELYTNSICSSTGKSSVKPAMN